MKRTTVAWIGFFGVAIVCQLLWGNFPATLFAFPINAAWLLLWGTGLWILWREKRKSPFVITLTGMPTTILLLSLLAVSCLLQGLSGWKLTSTWWFVALLAALMSHLLLVFFQGVDRKRRYKARFILIHTGLLLALTGGFIGAPDTQEWRAPISTAQPTREAFDSKGQRTILEHSLQLVDMKAEYTASGTPQSYKATLRIDNDQDIALEVNHPHRISWQDDLYLAAFGSGGTTYCVVQWVRQPWKHVLWTGIWLMIAGCVLLFAQGTQKKGGQKHDRDME